MTLRPRPDPPSGVAYALTVPQSVLFADISLKGNRKYAFESVWGLDYEPVYIAIDNGAMSWDYTLSEPFLSLLADGLGPLEGIERFVEGMGRTTREVEKTSALLSSGLPLPQGREPLRDRLRIYWDAYELHMTNLFTFWNVETVVSHTIAEELRAAGLTEELNTGFDRFIAPSEDNYFVRERRNRALLLKLYAHGEPSELPETVETASPEFLDALVRHAEHFGFLLAPFNLGEPPGPSAVLDSLRTLSAPSASDGLPDISDLSPALRRLARLTRQVTFWKNERLDVMSLGDARMLPHYRLAASELECPLDVIFALTRGELDDALTSGTLPSDVEKLRRRAGDYCLILVDGHVSFYEPTVRDEARADAATIGTVLQGTPASAGRVTGPVRIIGDLSDIPLLEPGDILVTAMTRPEYGVALDKAAAFVTDEGGRNCHAAIISREMGKPCVIATADATAILRNGMVVDVDGAAGRVEVIAA